MSKSLTYLSKMREGEYASGDMMFTAKACRVKAGYGNFITRYEVRIKIGPNYLRLAEPYDITQPAPRTVYEADALIADYMDEMAAACIARKRELERENMGRVVYA